MITLLIVLAFFGLYALAGYGSLIHHYKYFNDNGWAEEHSVRIFLLWPIEMTNAAFQSMRYHVRANYDPKTIQKNFELKEIEFEQTITNLELDAGMELSYPEFAKKME